VDSPASDAPPGQGSDGIINISSTYGHEAAAGASIYVGSKHAVEGVAKPVATRAGPVVAAGGFDRDGAMATVKSGDADRSLLHVESRSTVPPEVQPARSVRSVFWGGDERAPTIIQTVRS
jgi:NAD(P)-dependent dehydrogenase (short-subunit alcohol dehydrogenase family)